MVERFFKQVLEMVGLTRITQVVGSIVLLTLLAGAAQAQGLGIAGNLLNLSNGSRAFEVQTVVPGSLANRLGIRPGDQIESINGIPPGDAAINQKALSIRPNPTIRVVRNGARIELTGRGSGAGMRPNPTWPNPTLPSGPTSPFPIDPNIVAGTGGAPFLVYGGGNLTRLIPAQLGPNLQILIRESGGSTGLDVLRVRAGSVGQRVGFRRGDLITRINQTFVNTEFDFKNAYFVNNRRTMVFGVVRGSQVITLTLSQRHLTANPQPPVAAIRGPLGLKVFLNHRREVTVGGGDRNGLGAKLGLLHSGLKLVDINGRPIRSKKDLDELDVQLAEGKITSLVINIVRPDGQPDTVRLP